MRPSPHLLIRNGRVVSLFTGEVFPADVLVAGQDIAGVLPPGAAAEPPEVIDAEGRIVAPGYVDAHMHIESTFVTPAAFARLTLPRGTTTVLADPHEIVNVAGKRAMRWMIDAAATTAQTILYGVPSCVPAMAGFETAGAELDADDITEMLDWPGIRCLGEVMDYRAVVLGDERMLAIIDAARAKGSLIDGHCPGLSGADLSAYMAAGVDSDHTKNQLPVALEKARMGMMLQVQEKAVSAELMQALMAMPLRPPFCLVTDDVAPDAILRHGHLDHVARRAVAAGLPALEALRAITYAPAQRLRLYDRGLVSPGKRADLVLLDDAASFAPWLVIAGGRVVAKEGQALSPPDGEVQTDGHPFQDSIELRPLTGDDFRWRMSMPDGEARLRAIRQNAVDTSTEFDEVALPVEQGEIGWEGCCALLTVWERYGHGGSHAQAPITGLDLGPDGAVASTYAHDSHNLLVLGTSRTAMAAAAQAVMKAGGGIAVARGEHILALMALPIGGIMSAEPAETVVERAAAIREALHGWGYRHANAFMSMACLSLSVSPWLKLTDLGLVDVDRRAWAAPVLP